MINLNFGLFWSGSKLSYLRYMTFKSLRHFHPNSKITLYYATKFKKNEYKWGAEKQDFENDNFEYDYLNDLSKINVDIVYTDKYEKYQPNFQSDVFRWEWLDGNGIYLDTDQIILKSFETLPLDNDFIFTIYKAESCGIYSPVGVLCSSDNCDLTKFISENIDKFYNPNNYNSMGPFMFRQVLSSRKFNSKIVTVPSYFFYPAAESFMVNQIYDGTLKLNKDSYAIHWYGGSPLSQEFNKKYNKEFAEKSNDLISKKLREFNLL